MKGSWIVLAGVEGDVEFAREGRIDLGERHKLRNVTVAKSLVWARNVPASKLAAEIAKATAFTKSGRSDVTYEVFVYDGAEDDPLERARRDVLAKLRVDPSVARVYRKGRNEPLR